MRFGLDRAKERWKSVEVYFAAWLGADGGQLGSDN